jgi:hypothetical protein
MLSGRAYCEHIVADNVWDCFTLARAWHDLSVVQNLITWSEAMLMQVIGRYLRGRPREAWQRFIMESVDTGSDPKAAILEVIRPVYLALPLAVKRCFLSFAAFREGERIYESTLLDLCAGWELVSGAQAYFAAQSFLQKLEDAGLIQREPINPAWKYSRTPPDNVDFGAFFYMNSVVRDFATSIAFELQATDGGWRSIQPFFVMEVCSLSKGPLHVSWKANELCQS